MSPEDYTPETICQAMGISPFDPGPGFHSWIFRIVLKPSFDREVCITATVEPDGQAVISIVALVDQLWPRDFYGGLERTWTDSLKLDTEATARLRDGARLALRNAPASGRCLDGMAFSSLVRDEGLHHRLSGNVCLCRGIEDMLRAWLPHLHASIGDQGTRFAVARIASYVGLPLDPGKLPAAANPEIKVAVLGCDNDRHEVIAALQGMPRRHGDAKSDH